MNCEGMGGGVVTWGFGDLGGKESGRVGCGEGARGCDLS